MKVGHKIREIRETKKLSQESMAEALGLSVNGYGKIERNEVDINIERLQQIAKTLDIAPEDVLKDTNPVFNNYGTNQNNFSVIYEYSAKIEKLYEDKIKLLEEKIAWLQKGVQ
jgi:transcriptional regulator with XRE-family HTH domain